MEVANENYLCINELHNSPEGIGCATCSIGTSGTSEVIIRYPSIFIPKESGWMDSNLN